MDDREVIARILRAYADNKPSEDVMAGLLLCHLKASGRVIVPVEATEAMLEGFGIHKAWAAENYRAMIAAAKEPTDGR